MSDCILDHITVTAPNLAVGAAFVQAALGVTPQIGGEHPKMATHNLLLRLGDAMFLEVIAPNPTAPRPARARWFGLDALTPHTPAALSTWVVRTRNIQAAMRASSEVLGVIEPMQRGDINWLITLPADGFIPLQGVAPALIEWQISSQQAHPAKTLPDVGLSLARLDIFYPDPTRLQRLFQSLNLTTPIFVCPINAGQTPHLLAHIETPRGLRQLSSAVTVSL